MATRKHATVNVPLDTYKALKEAVFQKYGTTRHLSRTAAQAIKEYLPRIPGLPEDQSLPRRPPATTTPAPTPTPKPPVNSATGKPVNRTTAQHADRKTAQPTQSPPPTGENNPYTAPCGKDCKNPEGLKRHHEEGCLECTDLKLASKKT